MGECEERSTRSKHVTKGFCRRCVVTLRISTSALDSEGVMATTRLGKIDSNSADFNSLMAAAMTCRATSGSGWRDNKGG